MIKYNKKISYLFIFSLAVAILIAFNSCNQQSNEK